MKKMHALVLTVLLATAAFPQSVKLPDWNTALGTDGAVSYFFQPIDGLSMLGEDGALFMLLEMPWAESKLQSGQYRFNRYLMGTNSSVNLNNQFVLYFNESSNTFTFTGKGGNVTAKVESDTLALDNGLIGESTLLVIVQRQNDTISIRAVSGQDGTVYGGSETIMPAYVLNTIRGGDGFAVGAAASTADDSNFDRDRGHNGNMEFVGYSTAGISDADAQAIALGGDPVTILGESNLRWYRHLAGAETMDTLYATTSADISAPSVVRGAEYMVGGATIRRQAENRYLRLDYIPDGRVWGLTSSSQTGKTVALSGTQAGLTAGTDIEVRVVNVASGNTVVDWTAAATVPSGTAWTGSFTMPRSHGWDYIEIRSAADTSLVWRSRSRCGAGYKIAVIGQSENHYVLTGYTSNVDEAQEYTAADGAISYVTSSSGNPLYNLGNPAFPDPVRPQIFVAEPWDRLGDGVLTIGRQFHRYTDAPVCVVNHAKSGTGARSLADDASTERRWVDLEARVRVAGKDYSLMHWMWFASDRGYGLNYGGAVFDPVVLGINMVNAGSDHFVYDGTFDSSMVFAPARHWGRNCRDGVEMGDQPFFGFEDADASGQSYVECMIGQDNWMRAMPHRDLPWKPTVSQVDFPVGYNSMGDRFHPGHCDLNSHLGSARIGYKIGEYCARVMGFSTSENPQMKNAWFTNGRTEINVRFSLPNGGILRTDTDSLVAGLWVSIGDDTLYNCSEHTAIITDADAGIVTMTKLTGAWPESSKVGFVLDRVPLEQVGGYLYESAVDGNGTGALAMEGGLGIPVQPYCPVAYSTAIVTVQESDPEPTGAVYDIPKDAGVLLRPAGTLFDRMGNPVPESNVKTGIYFRVTGSHGLQKIFVP